MRAPVDDVDRIMAVMETAFDPAFGEAWNRRQVEDALAFGNCHYLLFDRNGMIAGQGESAAGFTLSRSGFEEEELLLFAVVPACRRRGIGRKMLVELTNQARARGARQMFLEMRRGNSAELLYRDFGFRPIGERPNYYRAAGGRHIDAITFARAID